MRHLEPIEAFGNKFDRGMTLFEFDAFREPEKTRFPLIGAALSQRYEFNEIPTPQMLWRGNLRPDLYIANQLDAVPDGWVGRDVRSSVLDHKGYWSNTLSLAWVSVNQHGNEFHEEFIEPMSRKITGKPSSDICAKYHRSIWLPLYWPETLRARKSLRTPFYYPKAGYAGAVEVLGEVRRPPQNIVGLDGIEINLAFLTVKPRNPFSVLFVVDESPIYRVTDMDVCAGIETDWHRWIVEFREPCGVMGELQRLALTLDIRNCAFDRVRLSIPTIENVKKGWKPRPHINDMLWEEMNATV